MRRNAKGKKQQLYPLGTSGGGGCNVVSGVAFLHQGYRRGVPPFFTTGSELKKGIPLSHQGYGRGVPLPDLSQKRVYLSHQGYGRRVPPFFTTGSEPKKGISFSDQGYGRVYPPCSQPELSQKRVYLSFIKARGGGYPQFPLPVLRQSRQSRECLSTSLTKERWAIFLLQRVANHPFSCQFR